eukprot:Sspe_Gene.39938::Locus_19250_Transcript_1_1_Confidence_1.000_Length_366::g.39938::m.39938
MNAMTLVVVLLAGLVVACVATCDKSTPGCIDFPTNLNCYNSTQCGDGEKCVKGPLCSNVCCKGDKAVCLAVMGGGGPMCCTSGVICGYSSGGSGICCQEGHVCHT